MVRRLLAGKNFTGAMRGGGVQGKKGDPGPAGAPGFFDMKSLGLPAITLLAAGTVREYTVTWNVTLPNNTYDVRFAPDAAALGVGVSTAPFSFAVKPGAENKTATFVKVLVTNNTILSLGASVVHVFAVPGIVAIQGK